MTNDLRKNNRKLLIQREADKHLYLLSPWEHWEKANLFELLGIMLLTIVFSLAPSFIIQTNKVLLSIHKAFLTILLRLMAYPCNRQNGIWKTIQFIT